MIGIRQFLKRWRWYHWTGVAFALLYLTYIALSYLYLPGKLKDIVQNDIARSLGRKVTVQRIAYNPFTIALTVDKFAIADRPHLPLVSWQRLFVNFNAWGSLFSWEAHFSTFQLDSPHIAIERRKNGFNFSDIVRRLSKPTPGKATSAPQGKKWRLALRVHDIRINDGRFRYDDLRGAEPAHSTMHNITLHVQDLYLATGNKRLNPIILQATMPGGGVLRVTGQYRADPVLIRAQINADEPHLEVFSTFLGNLVPVKLSNGRLTLQAGVEISMAHTLQVLLQQAAVTVTNLALDDATARPPLIRCNGIQVQGINMNLDQRRFSIAGVAVTGFETNQWLDAAGHSRMAPLLKKNKAPPQPRKQSPNSPWQVSVVKTVVKDSRVAFTDRRNGLDATQRIHLLDATLGRIQLNSATPVPVKVDAVLNKSGMFGADGQVTLAPFAADLDFHLQKLALAPFNPYLTSKSRLELKQGVLSVNGKVQIKPEDHQPLLLRLNTAIKNLKAADTRSGRMVLQWKALNIDQLKLNMAKRDLTIDKVVLDTPDIAGRRSADKKIDLATLIKPAATSPKGGRHHAKPAAAKASSSWQMALHELDLRHGAIRFTDAGIQPAYTAGLYAMNLKLDQFTNPGRKPAHFALKAKVDHYAPFAIKGTIAPSRQGFAFTSRLQGLEMPPFSTYTGTYIGYQLKSGTLGWTLKYDLRRHELKGMNGIVAKQLYLGNEVKSAKAVHLPIALGLALLRDANGIIDLNVGVSGNMNDPSFSVSGIIWTALKNIIVKAATSPFKLLAGLVGGGSEDLGSVEFSAGTSRLNAGNQKKLRELALALTKRPQLILTVAGSAGADADDAALQMQHVLQLIAAQRKMPTSELQPETLLNVKANRNALSNLNARLKLPSESKRKDTLAAAHPDLKGDALMSRVYRNMLHDVAARQTITKQDLLALADQRALAIKQFLVETAKLNYSRIRMREAAADDLRGRVCNLGVRPQ